jgi:DNA-binding CsgD family transcriptional regulator
VADRAWYSVSPRDYAVLSLLAVGFSVADVAGFLRVSRRTVEYRLYRLRLRFAVGSNLALLAFCAMYVLDGDLFWLTLDEVKARVFSRLGIPR